MLSPSIELVPPESILIPPDRQRKVVSTDDLEPSIRARGVINPIIVRETPEGLVLVAGERRTRAARNLSLASVPVRRVETLSKFELELIELEENTRREDLPWQDIAVASYRIFKILRELDPKVTLEKASLAIGRSETYMGKMIDLAEQVIAGDEVISKSQTMAAALNIIGRRKARAADDAIGRIMEMESKSLLEEEDDVQELADAVDSANVRAHYPLVRNSEPREDAPFSVQCTSAIDFFASYSGPRFNFLHCDFPYGVDLRGQANQAALEGGGYDGGERSGLFEDLCQALGEAMPRLLFPSSHVIFWFSMKHYEWTKASLTSMGLRVNPVPLVWLKTDNKGILPDARRGPRQIYETAFFASMGDRQVVTPVANAYGCPSGKADAIHTNEKPQPMLAHFMRMVVDERTRILDPTCGSGSAIRAAEALGAERGLGLEINPEFAERAASKLRSERGLRRASAGTA